jgi:hypothetical protein
MRRALLVLLIAGCGDDSAVDGPCTLASNSCPPYMACDLFGSQRCVACGRYQEICCEATSPCISGLTCVTLHDEGSRCELILDGGPADAPVDAPLDSAISD